MNIKKWLADREVKWYYRPWFVLFMLIFILGPIGLPLVYKSPKFNLAWKIGLTILMILYLWSLVFATIEAFEWALEFSQKLQGERVAS